MSTFSYIYSAKDENNQGLYAFAPFLSPPSSNLLSDADNKMERDYLKVKVQEEEAARDEGDRRKEVEESDDEEGDRGVYIPGGGLLDNLKTRDLRRLGQENEFDRRCVWLCRLTFLMTPI